MSNPELDKLDVANQPAEVTASLTLTINEVNIVLAALQELPHKVADGVIRKVVSQANEQFAPAQQG